MKDFFVSYTEADRSWAEWIAFQLEEEDKFTCVLGSWDFRPSSNFVLQMQQASEQTLRTIAILSPNYCDALYTQPEWAAAFAEDPIGQRGKLLPVRVRECELKGLLRPIIYIDLVGKDALSARDALLSGVSRTRAKPLTPPLFPGCTQRSILNEPRFPGSLPSLWHVPYYRNRNFTGRDGLLTNINAELKSGQVVVLTQAVRGFQGLGKTQVALEYAYRYASEYDVIWWLRLPEELSAIDYAHLARCLPFSPKELSEKDNVIELVRNWLSQKRDWLIIIDDLTEESLLKRYLPSCHVGHVLITSVKPEWGDETKVFIVDVFGPEEAAEFLLKRTGQRDIDTAIQLARELRCFPLALEQAGIYMEKTATPLLKYLGLFQRLRQAAGLSSIEDSTVLHITKQLAASL